MSATRQLGLQDRRKIARELQVLLLAQFRHDEAGTTTPNSKLQTPSSQLLVFRMRAATMFISSVVSLITGSCAGIK
jgi:hypothetical protein